VGVECIGSVRVRKSADSDLSWRKLGNFLKNLRAECNQAPMHGII
jgi:hypothetical protein